MAIRMYSCNTCPYKFTFRISSCTLRFTCRRLDVESQTRTHYFLIIAHDSSWVALKTSCAFFFIFGQHSRISISPLARKVHPSRCNG